MWNIDVWETEMTGKRKERVRESLYDECTAKFLCIYNGIRMRFQEVGAIGVQISQHHTNDVRVLLLHMSNLHSQPTPMEHSVPILLLFLTPPLPLFSDCLLFGNVNILQE